MPERTIDVEFYMTVEGVQYMRGEKVDLPDEEVERGDKLGAFEESETPFAAGYDARMGVQQPSEPQEMPVIDLEDTDKPENQPSGAPQPGVSTEGVVNLTDDQIAAPCQPKRSATPSGRLATRAAGGKTPARKADCSDGRARRPRVRPGTGLTDERRPPTHR